MSYNPKQYQYFERDVRENTGGTDQATFDNVWAYLHDPKYIHKGINYAVRNIEHLQQGNETLSDMIWRVIRTLPNYQVTLSEPKTVDAMGPYSTDRKTGKPKKETKIWVDECDGFLEQWGDYWAAHGTNGHGLCSVGGHTDPRIAAFILMDYWRHTRETRHKERREFAEARKHW